MRAMRICLLEDDLELGRSLQALLQNADHEVMWLRRIADARLWIAEGGFDAVVMDLGLPDGDGMELLRTLRRNHRKLPLLVITARDAIEDRLDGLDGGADDYLVKPLPAPSCWRGCAPSRAAARWTAASRSRPSGSCATWCWTSRAWRCAVAPSACRCRAPSSASC